MARFVIVCGLLRGYCDLFESVISWLRSDMFGCQYLCSNVLACDEFMCANGHYMA